MDKNILKLIKAELKDDFKRRGFKTEGPWYMRLANSQVYQTVNFQGSVSGDKFCVNIYLRPICSCNAFVKYSGYPIRLGSLAYDYDHWWDYSLDSVKEVTSLIRKIAFPILDGCTTYRGMLETAKHAIEDEYNETPGAVRDKPADQVLFQIDGVDWIRLLISLNEYEYCKFYINKKIRYYSNAIENNEEYERMKAQTNDTVRLQRIELEMEKLKNHYIKWRDIYKSYLEMVESGDLSEFIKETEENESKSLNALQKYIVNA